jgi:hypothetical protein
MPNFRAPPAGERDTVRPGGTAEGAADGFVHLPATRRGDGRHLKNFGAAREPLPDLVLIHWLGGEHPGTMGGEGLGLLLWVALERLIGGPDQHKRIRFAGRDPLQDPPKLRPSLLIFMLREILAVGRQPPQLAECFLPGPARGFVSPTV